MNKIVGFFKKVGEFLEKMDAAGNMPTRTEQNYLDGAVDEADLLHRRRVVARGTFRKAYYI